MKEEEDLESEKSETNVSVNEYGHRKMKIWQNIDKLDLLVQQILKKIPKYEYKMRSQIDNASDSTGANFVEGYYSGSTAEYIKFIKYGRRSLGELQERIRRLLRKGYLNENEYKDFDELSIKTMYLFDRLLQSLESKLEIYRGMKSVYKK